MTKQEIYTTIYREAVERYQNRFYKLGESPRALGWGQASDQQERFEVMVNNVDFSGKTVMDIGCGFADFYAFLKEKGIACKYIGVDIIPEFLDCAREKFPEAEFIEANFMLDSVKIPEADIVVTNGTLNFKQTLIDNMEYTKDFMNLAFNKARGLVIMDFLSTQLTPDYPKEDQVFYHNPQAILELAFQHTSDVSLIHNYPAIPQKEFMIFMYKTQK